ncbi:hypothetical protein HHL16_10880 [Pseudoflavitalea sp. G-6-1-2]|uniref:PKD-like domain-containing protein n=1 Tax=Pseudoflavitalea sp. G-6-1-2 TaxID=2728841 RepID=UPI00146CE90F|nr:PKD-like domain-containing protein [Pseudoflavitalea sp. G-6-1-2]NML21381.1 hypothetical protein [Pseudoflavitalea sp. G-6-1-2]
MKKSILLKLLTVVLFFAFACKKEQERAPSISGVGSETIVMNIGDKMVLAPNVTNLKGNKYTWLINGKEAATGQLNFTFEAAEPGNFDVAFKVENPGGSDSQTFKIFVEKAIAISMESKLTVAMCEVIDITPSVTGPDRNDYTYEWLIGDSVIGKNKQLNFISPAAGTYDLTLRATAGKQTASATRTITVKPATYVNNAFTVLEYLPAPAKNHNWSIIGDAEFWDYGSEFPLGYTDFLAKATEIRKQDFSAALILGSWGGSATFKFDHTVVNAPGKPDLELSATYSRLDLPAVYVAYDRNKNGQPDNDEWYEIKNEDYGIEDLPDYAITFTYQKTETDAKRISTYFNWQDNQKEPAKGEVINTKSYSSSMTMDGLLSTKGFFPGYNMIDFPSKQVGLLNGWKDTFTRTGKRITKDLTGAVSFSQKLNIDIDQAVNSKGERVQLPGINFVKIQKVVYPFQQDFINAGGEKKDFNMEEGRMLHVASITDKHLKN